MIQRIQSLYILAAILLSALLFFVPLAEFPGHEGALNILDLFSLSDPNGAILINTVALSVLNGIIVAITGIGLFVFKNRSLQARLVLISALLNLGLLGMFVWFIFMAQDQLGFQAIYQIYDVFPLINVIFLIIARRRIRIDDALVKSIDRIR